MTQKKSKQLNHRLGALWQLEPRMMFDGAAVATLIDAVDQHSPQLNESKETISLSLDEAEFSNGVTNNPIANENELEKWLANYQLPVESRNEIVFVDTNVKDYATILSGIKSDVQIVLLDSNQDGIEQIAAYITHHQSIDAIHVISHGDAGQLRLGTGALTTESMSGQYAEELATIKQALSEQADFLVYGCDFAEGDSGQAAVTLLSELTGADVAASTDLTGAATLGGDWELETQTGTIESQVVVTGQAQAAYGSVLDITTGLVGQWTFDTNANDASGNGNHGALVGNASIDTTTATNIVGAGKLSLDGVDDAVDLTSRTSSFSSLTQGTISAWVKLTATGSRTIFDIGDGAGGSNYVSFFVMNGQLELTIMDGGALVLDMVSTVSVNDGNWHHVVFTVGASGNQLYIDGTTAARSFNVGSSATTTFISALNSKTNTTIGAYNNGALNGEFLGTLDDVRVYNRTLTSGDVAQLYETSNDAPVITGLAGDSLAYAEGSGVQWIEQGLDAGVTDVDSIDFAGGTLTVSFVSGSDSAEDVLAVFNQGSAAGQIGVSGSNITYGGVTIGTVTGGSGGAALVITFNSNATPARVSTLVNLITYENTDTAAPTTGTRTVRYVLTDGDGGTSANYDSIVTVSEVNDFPTDLNLTASTVAEKAVNGIVVGTVSGTDPDTGDILTYSLTDSASGRFTGVVPF